MKELGHNLFVVGAGAHAPYSFPTARELSQKIKSLLKHSAVNHLSPGTINYNFDGGASYDDKKELCQLVLSLKIFDRNVCPTIEKANEYIDQFVARFAHSQVYSIDIFLTQRNKCFCEPWEINLGKLLISYFIGKNDLLGNVKDHQHDWVQCLINKYIRPDCDSFFRSPPKIITFNYDTFFEKSLIAHLAAFHDFKLDEAEALVRDLDIIHIYGRIQSHSDSYCDGIDYGRTIEQLFVVGEERDAEIENVRDKISKILTAVDRIMFLGFGFDKQNVEFLFDAKTCVRQYHHKLYATSIGVTPVEKARIIDLLRQYQESSNLFNNTSSPEFSCLDLLEIVKLEEREQDTMCFSYS